MQKQFEEIEVPAASSTPWSPAPPAASKRTAKRLALSADERATIGATAAGLVRGHEGPISKTALLYRLSEDHGVRQIMADRGVDLGPIAEIHAEYNAGTGANRTERALLFKALYDAVDDRLETTAGIRIERRGTQKFFSIEAEAA